MHFLAQLTYLGAERAFHGRDPLFDGRNPLSDVLTERVDRVGWVEIHFDAARSNPSIVDRTPGGSGTRFPCRELRGVRR
jgi:hypothetical protein